MPRIRKGYRAPWEKLQRKPPRESGDAGFYTSPAWRKLRAVFFANPDNKFCLPCRGRGVYKPANVADHIVPIKRGGDPLKIANLQPLCTACHASKSATERNNI